MVTTANWQRGGTEIEDGGSLQQIIDSAGLDYRVEPAPLMTADDAHLPVKNRVANVRVGHDGERRVLGVTSTGYAVVPNVEALAAFDYVVRQAGATYTRAGTIDKGRVAYAFAELPEPVEILPGDPVQRSLMFTNSFDGSTPLGFALAPVRVWCTNQLAMARKRGYGFSIRHNTNALDRAREAARLLGKATRAFDVVTEQMKAMARMPMDSARLQSYFESVAPLPPDPDRQERVRARHERWTRLFENGIGNSGPRTKTLYHALNAVTEDVDHRNLSPRVKDPVWYATLGVGGQLKQRAWGAAEKMIGVTAN